jgi:hypothetical protein
MVEYEKESSEKEIYRLIMEYRRSEESWSQRNQIITDWLRKYEEEVKLLTNNSIGNTLLSFMSNDIFMSIVCMALVNPPIGLNRQPLSDKCEV